MSKRTNKILVLAVVLVLALSMIGMVACGGDKGGNKDDNKTAAAFDGKMETLQTGFTNTTTAKKVTEKITIGGLEILLGADKTAPMISLAVNNVNVDLTRTYDENNVLTLDAKVYNLDVALGGGTDVLGIASEFINKKVDLNKDDKIDAKDVLNLDKAVLASDEFKAALKAVTIEANVKIDVSNADNDEYLVCDKVVISGLNSLPTNNGEPLIFLVNGDGLALDDPYEIIKPDAPKATNPRHPQGIFTALDKYSLNNAGVFMEEFIAANFDMASLYDFGALTVNGNDISFKGAADLSKVYTLGQKMADGYKGDGKEVDGKKVATIYETAKDAEGNSYLVTDANGNYVPKTFDKKSGGKYAGQNVTIERMANLILGSYNVKTIVNKLVDMGDVNMTGKVKLDGKTWKLTDMTSTQTVKLHIPVAALQKTVDLLPSLGLPIPGVIGTVIPGLLSGNSIDGTINVKTVSTFEY